MHSLKLKELFIRLDNSERLHGTKVPIIGLTGGIASGKSAVAKLFKNAGIKVLDADQIVKEVYTLKETKEFISSINLAFVKNNEIDFKILREEFFNNSELKSKIENYIYAKMPDIFLSKVEDTDSFLVYDVPLLFEKGLDKKVDLSICVACDEKTQLKRLMRRDEIEQQLALKIIDSQMPLDEKIDKCDLVIKNNDSFEALNERFQELMSDICM